jgi:hypothetical protein
MSTMGSQRQSPDTYFPSHRAPNNSDVPRKPTRAINFLTKPPPRRGANSRQAEDYGRLRLV